MWNILWTVMLFVNAGFLVRNIRKSEWLLAAISFAGAAFCVYNMS